MTLRLPTPASAPAANFADLKFSDLVLTPDQLRAILAPRAPQPSTQTLLLRKNEAHLAPAEQDAFRRAVQLLVDSGTYAKFVEIHNNMQYRMHTLASLHPTPASGTLRFLPWHRVFLRKFEEELRRMDPSVTIPYWDWVARREIPPWLATFKPNDITRSPGHPDALPSRLDIWSRLQTKPYVAFTLMLEGWTPQIPSSTRGIALDGAHNRVHVWVGGDMAKVMVSPRDPLFWLHHAQVDRLWHTWQLRNPGDGPSYTAGDNVMDPWPESYGEIADAHAYGYRYEEETFDLSA